MIEIEIARCETCGFEDDQEKCIHPCDNCGDKNWSLIHKPDPNQPA